MPSLRLSQAHQEILRVRFQRQRRRFGAGTLLHRNPELVRNVRHGSAPSALIPLPASKLSGSSSEDHLTRVEFPQVLHRPIRLVLF